MASRRADAAASWEAHAATQNAPEPDLAPGRLLESLCGARLSAIDQRFSDRFTVGMKIAKRKMIKAIQKDTHPSSFTL
jgi:hypothetical protein